VKLHGHRIRSGISLEVDGIGRFAIGQGERHREIRFFKSKTYFKLLSGVAFQRVMILTCGNDSLAQ